MSFSMSNQEILIERLRIRNSTFIYANPVETVRYCYLCKTKLGCQDPGDAHIDCLLGRKNSTYE